MLKLMTLAAAASIWAVPAVSATYSASDAARYSVFASGQRFSFDNDALFQWDKESGTATLTASATRGDSSFDIAMTFKEVDWWTEMVAGKKVRKKQTRWMKRKAGFSAADWQGFQLVQGSLTVDADSSLRLRGTDYAGGTVFEMFSRPIKGKFTFQVGSNGANLRNLDFGLAGWFGLEYEGQRVKCGRCRMNLDLEDTKTVARVASAKEIAAVPVPAGAALLPTALGLLWGARRRRRAV